MTINKPLKLIKDSTLQFMFLFSNADAFYITGRYSLLNGWLSPGCVNIHQSIELYIKAILSLDYEKEHGHDLVQLLQKYKTRDKYFSTILEDLHKVEFLRELSNAYITHRYGEAGAESNMKEIIVLADELAFNLRNIYIRNIKLPSNKIYIPNKVKEDFLLDNRKFTEKDLTQSIFAQFGLPIDHIG